MWNPADDLGLFYGYETPGAEGVERLRVGDPNTNHLPRPALRISKSPRGADVAALADEHVIALSGGDAMLHWLCADPMPALPRISVVGLRDVSSDALTRFGQSRFAAQVRRLVAYGDLDWTALAGATSLATLEALSLFVKERTCPRPPVEALLGLRELVIRMDGYRAAIASPGFAGARSNAKRCGVTIDTLATVEDICRSIAGPLEVLHLQALDVPVDAIVGNPALAGLSTLVLHHCRLRGAELLCGLHDLRVVRARNATDGLPQAIASCPRIEELELAGAEITDDVAIAIARDLPELRRLAFDQTAVGDAGALAIERGAPKLQALVLDQFKLGKRAAIALAESPRACVREAVRFCDFRSWVPDRDAVTGEATWPAAPAGVERSFVDEHVEFCTTSNCNGAGWGSEGHCPYHFPPELHIRSTSVTPIAAIKAPATAIETIEQSCVELFDALAVLGRARPLRTVRWHYRDGELAIPQPPPPFDVLTTTARNAKAPAWPHVLAVTARHHQLDDAWLRSIDAAVDMLERGAHLLAIDGDTVDLLWK